MQRLPYSVLLGHPPSTSMDVSPHQFKSNLPMIRAFQGRTVPSSPLVPPPSSPSVTGNVRLSMPSPSAIRQNYNTLHVRNVALNPSLCSLALHPLSISMDGDIERVLWTAEEIAARISELAKQISDEFRRFTSPIVVVGVATGAFLFHADIVRQITLPIAVDFIRAESYGSGTQSSGAPVISCDVKIDITGKHIILVEDIVDTGNTLFCLIAHLKSKGAQSVSVCALLDKPARRTVHFELFGEGKFYSGFECPDNYVVGYGLDFAELYRNLPYIGVLKPEKYS